MTDLSTATTEEVRREWCAALRSGEYKQTARQLRNMDGFCCLGVLCDLNRKAGRGGWCHDYYNINGILSLYSMPDIVSQWAGIQRSTVASLAKANDDGHSFQRIAEMIEAL